MRNTYSKRRSSAFSFIAMLLCVSMLLGTTMAWFTSSAESTGNRVQAGELGVQLLKHDGTDYKDISNSTGDIFSEADGTGVNWEPGRTEVVFLAVKNTKDLALNYTLIMDVINGTEPLTNALEYALIPAMEKAVFEALNLTCWDDILDVDGVITDDVVKGECFVTPEGDLLKGETEYFVLAVHMKEDADDSYQGRATTINVKVAARQMNAEADAFGNNYDLNSSYPGETWQNLIPEGVLDFESGDISPMVALLGEPSVADGRGGKVLMLETGERAQIRKENIPQAAEAKYKITGWFKRENPATVVTVTYYHKQLTVDALKSVNVTLTEEHIKATTEDGWNYFEVPIVHGFTSNLLDFRVNNHNSTGEAAGIVYFDDLQYVKTLSQTDLMVEEWKAKLATWEANSMMVQGEVEDPYIEKPAMGPNLLTNGDFSADTNLPLTLVNKEVGEGILAHPTGWETKYGNTFKPIVKITEDGTFYGEAPVGWTNTTDYKRIVPQIHQTIAENIVPGAQYQVKFRYRIEPTEWPGASWYGPYAYVSSYGPDLPGVGENTIDYKILRPDQSTQGLLTDGQWHWYTQTMYISGQAESIGFDMCAWLYEGDWIEIDDIQFYLVDMDAEIELGYETKFFFDDMGTTTFTADLLEDMYPDLAQDTGIKVKFEVFDGKNLVWNTDKLALNGEGGYVASAEFDLAKMTKKGEPYVLKATLYGSDNAMICETSEQIFVYDRPDVLDASGNYIKTTPNGDKLDFNLAYAVVQDHYDETLQIGSNIMSLSNATGADQVLERLDYCLKYGYMGMLNMNWGLYNDSDIDSKRWVLIDVASDERVRNHPALLGYCLTDEPWSWGSEKDVAENLEEGYRLIREYDKENIIFSVNNMVNYHDDTVKYGDVMFVDHYEPATNAVVYNKTTTAFEAANGRMPTWVILGAYKNRDFVPTGDAARNNNWQAFIAGADGIGYYAITYGDRADDGTPIPMWEIVNGEDTEAGQKLWNGLKSFKEKEWDIAYDHFVDGEGADFNEKIAIADGYIYSSWVVNGEVYLIVLNVKGSQVTVNVNLTSDEGNVSIGAYSATVINGSDQADFTGNGTLSVTMEKDQAILYKITPDAPLS